MTNEEKAKQITWQLFNDGHFYHNGISQRKEIEKAVMTMAYWKEHQLKEVCRKCEQHIIDSGKKGCAYRSLANEYCWED